MKPPGPEAPVVLVKWYDYAKWLLERGRAGPPCPALAVQRVRRVCVSA